MKWNLTEIVEHVVVGAISKGLRTTVAKSLPESRPPREAVLIGREIPADEFESGQDVWLTLSERRRHMYVLGATGSGKTNLLMNLIDSDLKAGRSLCVIDLRGDLIERILTRLATIEGAGEKLCLIDLRNDNWVTGFNPLQGSGDVYARALHVLGVIRRQADSWGVQLEETLRNCLIALADTGWSLLEIEPLLGNSAFRASVLEQVSDPYVRGFFERYEALSAEQKTTWTLATLNKVTPLLAVPQLRRMFGCRAGIDFKSQLDTPGQIILVALAADRFHDASHLVGGLIVSSIENAIMARTNQPEEDREPVNLFIDEFETMASDSFETIVAEGRRFGLSLVLSHQNLSQVPVALRQVLRNNVHLQIYFQTGSTDASELAGEIATKDTKEVIRQSLISQKVGEAFLIRRGQTSIRIKTPHSPDPRADRAKIKALCQTALAKTARPAKDIDAELAARLTGIKSPETSNPNPEVRHEKLPRSRRTKP